MAKNFIPGVNDVVYSKGTGNIFQTVEKKALKEPKVSADKSNESGDLIQWGPDNLFPQNILKDIRTNTIIGPTLKRQAEIAYDDIIYGTEDENGNFKRVIDEKVEAFFRRSHINRYSISALRAFYFFYLAVPELILTKDKKEVYSIRCDRTAHFRFMKQNNMGIITHGYMNADWESHSSLEDSEYVTKIPLINIYDDPASLKDGSEFKYIYPLAYPTEDEKFYPLVDWNSARTSGWLDVAQSIPLFKKALFKNQITMKYLIQVPSWWWEWKYPGFEKFGEKLRKETIEFEADKFEKFTKGEDNTGNSLMVTFISDPKYQKEYKGWTVEAIDNKLKDGIYIEDSNEASSHLLYALSMDPTLIGAMPGSKLGSGSGSDKRVAFNIYINTIKPHQDLILEPLPWIGEYNGWTPYKYKFKNQLESNSDVSPATQPSKSALNENEEDPMTEPNQQAS
jgi:hypothetical protein